METNLKIIQTEIKIQKAFIKLVNLNGFDKLSVKDLVNEAQINRGTFYLHYLDKYDLIEKYENEVLLQIEDIFNKYPKASPTDIQNDKYNNAFFQLFKYLYSQKELAVVLMKSPDSVIIHKAKLLILRIVHSGTMFKDKVPTDFANEILSQGIIDFILYWLSQEKVKNPKTAYKIFLDSRSLSPELIIQNKNNSLHKY
ncbi:TetR family transcriptional regulator [Companilactobacillus nantensis]|uniref:Transcriptional regulator n=1 Tax=Companilactobacillus nantensis DSM 16982 TaxID=1423774 RepID=A0A0R1WST1_9LACO|nr:TetR family transcriptional regulator [Companilactobacillus nantensis]KRM18195.1 transcriptional regulator [Companilactobacillus nantensis DSM 16982]GEO62855.1 TetR family transcriptional regulator [Companilactobacillus nantensis]